MGDWYAWETGEPEPRGIKLDLDLFEPIGRNSVRVAGSRAIEHGGRPAYVPLTDFSPIGIRAEHEERQHGPVVGVFQHPRMAAVDGPRDDGPCEFMQQHSGFANRRAFHLLGYCRPAGGTRSRFLSTLNPSNTIISGRDYPSLSAVATSCRSMLMKTTALDLELGTVRFSATLRCDLAPRSCEQLMKMLPYQGAVIHARWSGEALWCPLAAVWPAALHLPQEHATCEPNAGKVLLYAGDLSEPELLIPYGTTRFSSKAGILEGNPVLTIDDPLSALPELGRGVLWKGAMQLRIEYRSSHPFAAQTSLESWP